MLADESAATLSIRSCDHIDTVQDFPVLLSIIDWSFRFVTSVPKFSAGEKIVQVWFLTIEVTRTVTTRKLVDGFAAQASGFTEGA